METFCHAFKQYDDQRGEYRPTNPVVQKDSHEFLTTFLERLGDAMKNTSRRYLVEDTFGFELCNESICTACKDVKPLTTERHLNLSLPVRGFKSVQESLASMVTGEKIEKYQCDNCNQNVMLQRSTKIKTTPNVLIVHL